MLTNVLRLRREVSVLKRDIRAIKKQQDSAETHPPPG
jgi:hypothetical protein